MANPTWRNVEAPSFRDSMDGFRLMSDNLNRAFSNARDTLTTFQRADEDKQSNAFLFDLAKYAGNPEKLQADLNSGTLQSRYDPSKLNKDALDALATRPGALIRDAASKSDLDFTSWGRKNTQTDDANLRAAAPWISKYQELKGAGNDAGAQQVLDANRESLARLHPSVVEGLLKGGMNLARDQAGLTGTRLNNFITDRRFDWEGTDRQEERDATKLAGEWKSKFLDGADLQRHVNQNYSDLVKQYGPQVVEAALGRAVGALGGPNSQYDVGSGGGSGGAVNVSNILATPDNASAVVEAAKQLGTTPEDLATVISYETGGKFDPDIVGGKNNNHMGLIQFGAEERAKYGIKPGMGFQAQMGAVVNYLKDRGFKPGMDIRDLYSTINAGQPGRYNASDGNGTVNSHVDKMLRDHRNNAVTFLKALSNPKGTTTNISTGVQHNLSGAPDVEVAREFQEAWSDKSTPRDIAAKLVADGGQLKGEDIGNVTDKVIEIMDMSRQNGGDPRINAAMAGRILARSTQGNKGWFGRFVKNVWGQDGFTADTNDDQIRTLVNFASNRDLVKQTVLSTQAQTDSSVAAEQARVALSNAEAALTKKLRDAERKGIRKPDISVELANVQRARDAFGQYAVTGGGMETAGAKGQDPVNRTPEETQVRMPLPVVRRPGKPATTAIAGLAGDRNASWVPPEYRKPFKTPFQR